MLVFNGYYSSLSAQTTWFFYSEKRKLIRLLVKPEILNPYYIKI